MPETELRDKSDELFRLASLVGCEPEDEERHRKQLLDYIQRQVIEARISEVTDMPTGEPYGHRGIDDAENKAWWRGATRLSVFLELHKEKRLKALTAQLAALGARK